MTVYLIYLFFFLLSLGQVGRITLPSIGALYLHEVAMMLVVVLSFQGVRQIQTGKSLLVFLGVLTLSLLISLPFHSLNQNIVAVAYLVRVLLYFAFYYSLHLIKKAHIERGLFIFAAFTIVFSYLQYFLIPTIQFLKPLGWDPHEFRVFGTFLDVNPAGIIFILLFFWLFINKQIGRIRPIGLTSLIGLILLTYSRITYIGFIFGLLFLLVRRFQTKYVLAILITFILLIPFLPRPLGESARLERVFSIESRFIDIQKGIELWKQHPLIGVGYNHIPVYKSKTSDRLDHSKGAYSSSFVTILAASGMLGLGAFLFLLWSIYMRTSLRGQLATGVILVTSLFDNVFLTNFVLAVYLTLIALENNR